MFLGLFTDMPPLNVFLPENANKSNSVKFIYAVRTLSARRPICDTNLASYLLQHLKVGDIIYGKIQSLQPGGCLIRCLCTGPPNFQIFTDVKARVTHTRQANVHSVCLIFNCIFRHFCHIHFKYRPSIAKAIRAVT